MSVLHRIAPLLFVSSACAGAPPAQPASPPPIEVTVAEVKPQSTELSFVYAGRVTALQETEVRARVAGELVERTYTEGDKVNAGDLLFRIDPAPYDTARKRAKAELAQQHAALAQAESDERLAHKLFESGSLAPKQHDDAIATAARARAAVAAAEAGLRSSSLELGYTSVRASISGVTSIEALPHGSLVSVGTLLTRIRQVDPVYVEFAFESDELAEIRRRVDAADLRDAHLPAQVTFADGTAYEHEGVVDFVEAGLDRMTSTVHARAVFQNPKGALVPGEFVRIAIGGAVVADALVAPEKALFQTVQGQFVYVVGADNKAAVRSVTLGREVNGGWLVERGLAAGDRVITEGVIKVRPGSSVKPMSVVTETAQAAKRNTHATPSDADVKKED